MTPRCTTHLAAGEVVTDLNTCCSGWQLERTFLNQDAYDAWVVTRFEDKLRMHALEQVPNVNLNGDSFPVIASVVHTPRAIPFITLHLDLKVLE